MCRFGSSGLIRARAAERDRPNLAWGRVVLGTCRLTAVCSFRLPAVFFDSLGLYLQAKTGERWYFTFAKVEMCEV